MSDDVEHLNVGSIHELDYWCEPKAIFQYLDMVSPGTGSKFKCPVCANDQWGCAAADIILPDGTKRNVVAPCDMPSMAPDGSRLMMGDRPYPNYHYAVVCLTCANTVFLNAAMVQGRLKVVKGIKHDE